MSLKVIVAPVTPFEQNCSIAYCTETMKGAAVDPGGDIDRIKAIAEKEGITFEKILITHGHLDHAGGAASLAEQLGIPIEGPHTGDKFIIDALDGQGKQFGFADTRSFTPDRWLEGGETVSLGNLTLDVRHCPGHTPGHIIFFERGSAFAFVGDVLFAGSVGRSDLPGGSHDTLVKSITEELWPLGDDVTFVPGHGPNSTFGRERQMNPFVCDLALGR